MKKHFKRLLLTVGVALALLLMPYLSISPAQRDVIMKQEIPEPTGDKYGAIAYSESAVRWGTSYDYHDRQAAEDAAVNNCGTGDCKAMLWFKNSCGALAKSSNGALGWAWDGDLGASKARALAECQRRGGNCKILCWSCTTR